MKDLYSSVFEKAVAEVIAEAVGINTAELEERETNWSKKYSCVVNFEGAEKVERSDGTTAYIINGDAFFNNGRRSKDGKMVNYSCEDPMF